MQASPAQRRADLGVVLLVGVVSLALNWWASHGRPFWSDELFGWMLVTDPSLHHMITAWHAGADGGGIGFYLLARLWIALFGRSELVFRLLSASGFAVSAALTYLSAQRFFSRGLSLFSVSLIWFSSSVLLWQLQQARFYGVLLAAVAFALYLAILSLEHLTPTLLALNLVANTLLVATHPFGALYNGCILLGLIAVGAASGSFVPRLYLSVASGWWPLLVSLTAMRNTAAIGKPSFWTTPPHWDDLIAAYLFSSIPLELVFAAASLLLVVSLFIRRRRGIPFLRQPLNLRPLLLTAPLLALPCLIALVSCFGTSIFADRYLAPVAIACCFFLCQLLLPIRSALAKYIQAPRLLWGSVTLLLSGTLLNSVRQFHSLPYPPLPYPDAGILALTPRDLPIVFERIDTFDQLLAYHRQEGYHFFYLLDWENILAPGSPRGEAAGYHEMEIWRKVGYFSGSILPVDAFFPVGGCFLVVDEEPTLWFDRKLRHNPNYIVQLLGTHHRSSDPQFDARVWLVSPRGASGPPP